MVDLFAGTGGCCVSARANPHLPRPPANPAAAHRSRLVARADRRHPQSGELAQGQQAPRPDPDGHRQRQDLHRHQLHLPPDQVRRRPARAVSGGPGQPGPPDQERVRPVQLALQQLQVRRGIHRPAPAEQPARPHGARHHLHHPAAVQHAQGPRAGARRRRAERGRPGQPVQSSPSPSPTTPPSPSRPSTSSSPTKPTAASTTCGARCWSTSTPTSSA
jgi:hypothetical protein